MSNKKIHIILFLIILAIAVFFRFWHLEQIPPGLYPDVAINGTDALQALKTGEYKLFYPENNGREGLFINLIAFSFWLFGASTWALKFVPAVFGTLTVVGIYLFTKELFKYINPPQPSLKGGDGSPPLELAPHLMRGGVRGNFCLFHGQIIALLSTFFLATSFWHVNFSRLGFRAIMVPFFLVWSFYFLFKGLNATQIHESHTNDTNKKSGLLIISYWLLAGLAFGLGFHTYIAFRVAPLILLPVLFFAILAYWPRFKFWLKNRKSLGGFFKIVYFKDGWWRWDVFFIAIIIAALPMIYYFAQHPQDFTGRTGQVSVFAAENPIKELAISTVKSLGMFNIWGDCNWRHNYACRPVLLWPVGIFFLIGFFWSIFQALRPRNWRQKKWPALTAYWTLIFWFFTMLLPEILTREGLPHALRSIGAIPAVFIFAGLGCLFLYNKLDLLLTPQPPFKKGARGVIAPAILIIVLLLIGAMEYQKYFLDWGVRQETKDEFSQDFIDMGNYLNGLPDSVRRYVMVNLGGVPVPYPDGIPMPAQTIMFITNQKPAKYLVPEKIPEISCAASEQCVILLMAPDNAILSKLQRQFPQGRAKLIQNEFTILKINF